LESERKKEKGFQECKKWNSVYFTAAYAAEHLLLQKNFFETQNPRLINKSSFKSGAAYDGVRTVVDLHG
jgi:hypothetical protein